MPAARIQPQGRVRLNRANPLAQGLAFAYVAQGNNTFVGYTTGAGAGIADQAPVDSATRVTRAGFGKYSKTGSAYVSRANIPAMVSAAYSLFAFGTNATTSGTSQAIDDDDSGGSRKFQFRLNNGAVELITFAGGSPFFATQPAALTLAEQSAGFAMGASVSASSIASFQNGRKTQTTVANSNAPTGVFNIGSSKAGSSFWTAGGLSLIAGWNRTLTDDEQRSLAANPWQLFEGQPAMLSAASAPTGTGATATPSGVSASSAVGSILASGQGRAAPAGVSATASTGTATAAGTTVVNGTASPAGVSAAAAVGAPAASGAANKAVAGVSASASVGTATAAGTTVINGSAAPAGVSASAAVGSASASGATVIHGNASAAGVSASSALGATVARGSASAAANGVQAAATVGLASANGGVSVAGNAQPAGVTAATSVGTPSASGATVTHGNASAAGVAASTSVGVVAISASASVQPAGVSVLATIGLAIASGQIKVNGAASPGGVLAYARVGSVTAGSRTYASAPAGPGYSRPFANTTRPRQVNTRRR